VQGVWLTKVMIVFSNLYLWLGLWLLLSILMFKKNKKDVLKMWLTIAIVTAVVIGLKFLIQMERPEEVGYFIVKYAFPSLHTALAFGVVPFLSKIFRKEKLWFSLAILIGLSRLYLLSHFLSDVVFGAFLGYLIALTVEKRWK
jgi:undecaprenyl-diphosphatase